MRVRLLVALFASVLALGSARAANGGFIATLSSDQQTAAGLTHLNADAQTTLNTLVAREVSLARQGNVRAFAGTFSSRRKPTEFTAAGLDQLSAAELASLDQLVAAAIAAGPAKPELPSRLKSSDVSLRDRLKVHGSVTVAYGWGGGRDMRAGSIYTTVTDPESGFTLGLGYSEFRGDGWWDCGPYDSFHYARPSLLLSGDELFRGHGGCRRW